LYLVMGFAAGVLIAAALVELLPEALELASDPQRQTQDQVALAAVLGFLAYYSVDVFVHLGAAGHQHRHGEIHQDHLDHPPHDRNHADARFGAIAALGLTLHSFLDGFAIGSFHTDAKSFILVATAVLAHDFGDGVTTVGIVLGSKGGLRASIGWLLADAAAPVIGCAAALTISLSQTVLANLLGFFGGTFLFIGAAHLLPEAQHEARRPWLYFMVIAGFAFVIIVTRILKEYGY
jgi:zinc transporter ZupT